MPVRKSTFIGDTLNKMASPLIRHLTILQCAKLALVEAAKAIDANQTEAWCGADDSFTAILELLGDSDPVELTKHRPEGVRLKKRLFHPLTGISMTPWQDAVYRAGLRTAEIQMRRLYDSTERYPEVYGKIE